MLQVEVVKDRFYITSCKALFGEWKSGLTIENMQLVLFPNKPSAIDCLPELLKRWLWGIPGLKWLSLLPISFPVCYLKNEKGISDIYPYIFTA